MCIKLTFVVPLLLKMEEKNGELPRQYSLKSFPQVRAHTHANTREMLVLISTSKNRWKLKKSTKCQWPCEKVLPCSRNKNVLEWRAPFLSSPRFKPCPIPCCCSASLLQAWKNKAWRASKLACDFFEKWVNNFGKKTAL